LRCSEFKDNFQSVLRSLSSLMSINIVNLDGMRIDVIRYEPHNLIFESFQILFPTASLIFELFFCQKKYLLVGASGMLWTGQWVSE